MIRLQIFGPLKKLVLDSFSYFNIFFINTFPQLQTGSEIIFKFFSEMAFWFLLCWLLANLFGLITPEIHNVDYQKNLPEKSGGKKLFYSLKDMLFKYFIKKKKGHPLHNDMTIHWELPKENLSSENSLSW